MSEINIKIIKCDGCGETIRGRSDNGSYINQPQVKIENKNFKLGEPEGLYNLDFCCDCWEHYYVPRSRNKRELFELIEKELNYPVDEDNFYYEYVHWNYIEKWKID